MEWIEVTGRTVEEAKELALDRLGIVEDELEFEVVTKPRAGFLRVGSVEARLRARIKPLSREKPQDRRRARLERQKRAREGNKIRSQETQRTTPEESSVTKNPIQRGGAKSSSSPKSPQKRRARKPSSTKALAKENPMVESTVAIEDQATSAEEFAAGMVEAFGIAGADVTSTVVDDVIKVDVHGADLGLLVGPKGATLAAFEELVRAMARRGSGGLGARIYVDMGGYRERRREALAAFTRSLAQEVKDAGASRALEPMGASDRKVVHDTVAEMEGVGTTSEGEEPRRYVVIQPS